MRDFTAIHFEMPQGFQETKTIVNTEINPDLQFLEELKIKEIDNDLEAIDFLYEYLNPSIESNNLFKIDTVISFFIRLQLQLKLAIALLTITNTIKDLLTERNNLIDFTKGLIANKGISKFDSEKLLKGL